MDVRPTWTDCDETVDYVLPYVLRPRDLVSRPGNMDETVPHIVARRAHQILRISGRSLFINSRIIRKINDALSVGVKISLTFGLRVTNKEIKLSISKKK